MFKKTNPNPNGIMADDGIVRAIAIADDRTWNETFINLCLTGLVMYDMPSSKRVWQDLLKSEGYKRYVVPEEYTVRDFCGEFFRGTFILDTGERIIAVRDGDYLDTYDSGNEQPIFYWRKGKNYA